MVRAVALQTTPSGTYFNASQGIFANLSFNNLISPIVIVMTCTANALTLSWNSHPGTVYHVEANTSLTPGLWPDVSGAITASANTTSWTDTNLKSNPQRFYRVVAH